MTFRSSTGKMWIPVILASLGVLLASGCGKSGKDQAPPAAETKAEAPAVETAAPPAVDKFAGWVEYGSEPHLFSILTPKSFEVSRDKTATEAGDMDIVIYLAELAKEAYGVVISDFPPGFVDDKDAHAILKGGSEGFISHLNGTVTGEQTLELDGHAGLEITMNGVTQGFDILAKGRFYLVGDRLYQVSVIAEKGHEDLEAIDHFLRSFKLK